MTNLLQFAARDIGRVTYLRRLAVTRATNGDRRGPCGRCPDAASIPPRCAGASGAVRPWSPWRPAGGPAGAPMSSARPSAIVTGAMVTGAMVTSAMVTSATVMGMASPSEGWVIRPVPPGQPGRAGQAGGLRRRARGDISVPLPGQEAGALRPGLPADAVSGVSFPHRAGAGSACAGLPRRRARPGARAGKSGRTRRAPRTGRGAGRLPRLPRPRLSAGLAGTLARHRRCAVLQRRPGRDRPGRPG